MLLYIIFGPTFVSSFFVHCFTRLVRRAAIFNAVLLGCAVSACGKSDKTPIDVSIRQEGARPVNIVSSVRPLGLIVRDLLNTVPASAFQLNVLLPPGQSPHHYTASFSDVKALKTADLLVWVGEALETFLEKPVTQFIASENELRLYRGERNDGSPTPLASGQSHRHSLTHNSDDAHVWLSYADGAHIGRTVAAALARILPDYAPIINANLQNLENELKREKQRAHHILHAGTERQFGVYHDGYSRFVHEFALQQTGYVTMVPEQQVSVKKLVELKAELSGAHCLLADAIDYQKASRLADKLEIRGVSIDILAANYKHDDSERVGRFSGYMRRIVASFYDCLYATAPNTTLHP